MNKIYPSFIFLFWLAVAAMSCTTSEKTDQNRPNIVWVTSEDNSKHYMDLFDENGVPTPNIKSLAESGLTFTRAFSNSPVCSAARSTLISGCYGPRVASHYHRKIKKVPMPEGVEMFPAYLRQAGYYTTNNSKEDYNFIKPDNVWDESSDEATWKNRQEGQPFFHVFNITTTHESRLHFSQTEMDTIETQTDLQSFTIQPNHPQTEIYRYTNAYYRDKIQQMDQEVGEVLAELKAEGMMENTFVFYFADHGGVLPGSKGYLYETGLHVPLVVHIPEQYKDMVGVEKGTEVNGFVSFVDFAPTVLTLAGVDVPAGMDGNAFLGEGTSITSVNERDVTYGYADRFDEKYDMVRSVRIGKYKYIRSYQPFNVDGLRNNYRYRMLAFQEWQELYKKGALNAKQSFFYEPREPEMLFDIEEDPYETTNLAQDTAFSDVVLKMRSTLDEWLKGMPDLSFYPEHYLVENAFDNPAAFGQENKAQIHDYIEIADLSLISFENAKQPLESALQSDDPWKRYWAVVVCNSFDEQALEFEATIRSIARDDAQPMNRVRASEFLALVLGEDPTEIMTNALYASDQPAEALLILNSVVLMQDSFGFSFKIQLDNLTQPVRQSGEVSRRLKYLGVMEEEQKHST